MKDLTIIIPLYEEYKVINKRLEKAINSIKENKIENSNLIIVGPKISLNNNLKKSYNNIELLENTGKTDFCSQINLAVSKCKTKYFTILEYDDTFHEKWFSILKEYIKYKPEVDIFMPLNEAILDKNGESIGYINEAVWSSSFSEELGFVDLECLNNFSNFNMTGALLKTKNFIEDGGLKSSMKISFWYEFMLRTAYLGRKLYVIPKVGYYHTIDRNDSLTEQYHNEVSQEEAEWWISLAQQEYLYKKDREKTFEK